MEYNTFLEELEKRLSTLEEEINKHNQKKSNDYMMESLQHSFDEAMDESSGVKPGFSENNNKLLDY